PFHYTDCFSVRQIGYGGTSPLIDICGTPYNTEQAVERMHVVSREAAEAALKEREAIQNVLDKQDKG
ncbi:hypothetical protein, partial [Ruthenibacterium lactatiformans]|uniref:hypothetical protein n=1 Tax=Ruthenibacterium lactatiformans TaxID=1550024 RepID=UPI0019689D20